VISNGHPYRNPERPAHFGSDGGDIANRPDNGNRAIG
jgi:hypothetical protein